MMLSDNADVDESGDVVVAVVVADAIDVDDVDSIVFEVLLVVVDSE